LLVSLSRPVFALVTALTTVLLVSLSQPRVDAHRVPHGRVIAEETRADRRSSRYSSGCFNSRSMGLSLTPRFGFGAPSTHHKRAAVVSGNPSLRPASSALVLIVPRLPIRGTTSYLFFRRGM
jgi:hypothetical protein